MMEKINLFIIGTQKGGTTALADFLGKHPDIYIVDGKEAHVFDDPFLQDAGIDNIQCAYKPFLKAYHGQPVRCDATPVYMYLPEIPARLSHYNEDAKIIIILRDPAERALSQYHMERRRGDEHLPYPLALCAENSRLKKIITRTWLAQPIDYFLIVLAGITVSSWPEFSRYFRPIRC